MLCCCAAVGYLCLCLYLCLHFVKIRELDLVPAQTSKNADVVYLCLCLCLRFKKNEELDVVAEQTSKNVAAAEGPARKADRIVFADKEYKR